MKQKIPKAIIPLRRGVLQGPHTVYEITTEFPWEGWGSWCFNNKPDRLLEYIKIHRASLGCAVKSYANQQSFIVIARG